MEPNVRARLWQDPEVDDQLVVMDRRCMCVKMAPCGRGGDGLMWVPITSERIANGAYTIREIRKSLQNSSRKTSRTRSVKSHGSRLFRSHIGKFLAIRPRGLSGQRLYNVCTSDGAM